MSWIEHILFNFQNFESHIFHNLPLPYIMLDSQDAGQWWVPWVDKAEQFDIISLQSLQLSCIGKNAVMEAFIQKRK